MPKLAIEVPHSLGQKEAAERLQGYLEKVKERYGSQVSNMTDEWNGNTLKFGFTTFGFTIKGALDVQEDKVALDGEIPFAAMMFKGKIESEVRSQLTKVLT